ncbi:endonuclease [Brevibacillus sp. SYP-B805]|uniref:endonuclease III domain-containing protein n=1 Tax=Brevibacillus sp. SYP-B805 TaxID=1578199 RepID=UPI0013EBC51F|nr:endonuclease [Brevibacillus sp. SYP-B805]NGQ93657.1 endonuclease [Brevibacillus sp. SYP-B805]
MWKWLYQRLGEAFAGFDVEEWWGIADPFERMIGAILVQNTTWTNAAKALENLRANGLLTPQALVFVPHEELVPVIRPAGFQTSKAAAIARLSSWLREKQGVAAIKGAAIPTETLRQELLALKGIGEETADTILAYAFDRPTISGDAYTRRLYERLTGASRSYAQIRSAILAELTDPDDLKRLHGMIVEHGKAFCRKQAPRCETCVLLPDCLYARQNGAVFEGGNHLN